MPELVELQRRAHYRLRYPEDASDDAPSVFINGQRFRLLELAEGGARIQSDGDDDLLLGKPIGGEIQYPGQGVDAFEATVLRIDRPLIVLRFQVPIGFKRMLDEQRRMISKYPQYYRPTRIST
ncbi:MAG: PilZ domain-containing protein [Thiotrichales bacterium]